MGDETVIQVQASSPDGAAVVMWFEQPHECPICHHGIEPKPFQGSFRAGTNGKADEAEVLFRCPRKSCERVFIARYKAWDQINTSGQPQNNPAWWQPHYSCVPTVPRSREFGPTIAGASSNFVGIYGQAEQAEAMGLDQICGAGYRKALEFLIKDYLKTVPANAEKHQAIENNPLAACIANFVNDPRLKSTASRAAWLGNDETHYVRKWEDKDLKDLKGLIDLTVYWISSEILTGQLEQSIPDPKRGDKKAAEA
jgi:hypothetical protein